jgi:cytosine/uracil/thiamine/allantoin permease
MALALKHDLNYWYILPYLTLFLPALITISPGGFSTLAVNISDFSRFAKKPGSQVWQLPFIPLFKIICSLFGLVAASASKPLYGKVLWQPLDIVAMWQGTPGGRAAAFFCAALWCLAQICVNISANSISFGNGICSLLLFRTSLMNLSPIRHYLIVSEIF